MRRQRQLEAQLNAVRHGDNGSTTRVEIRNRSSSNSSGRGFKLGWPMGIILGNQAISPAKNLSQVSKSVPTTPRGSHFDLRTLTDEPVAKIIPPVKVTQQPNSTDSKPPRPPGHFGVSSNSSIFPPDPCPGGYATNFRYQSSYRRNQYPTLITNRPVTANQPAMNKAESTGDLQCDSRQSTESINLYNLPQQRLSSSRFPAPSTPPPASSPHQYLPLLARNSNSSSPNSLAERGSLDRQLLRARQRLINERQQMMTSPNSSEKSTFNHFTESATKSKSPQMVEMVKPFEQADFFRQVMQKLLFSIFFC